jgi:hypothetical protein
MNLQEQVLEDLSKQMADSIDLQIMFTMLKEDGWTSISITRFQDNHHAVDITYWLEENIKGEYLRDGRDFIFKESKDAILFTLRWAT